MPIELSTKEYTKHLDILPKKNPKYADKQMQPINSKCGLKYKSLGKAPDLISQTSLRFNEDHPASFMTTRTFFLVLTALNILILAKEVNSSCLYPKGGGCSKTS